jgi:hypothetical protein
MIKCQIIVVEHNKCLLYHGAFDEQQVLYIRQMTVFFRGDMPAGITQYETFPTGKKIQAHLVKFMSGEVLYILPTEKTCNTIGIEWSLPED